MLNQLHQTKCKTLISTDDFCDSKVKDFGWNKFYPLNKLYRDGFIFPDGSLRFEFSIKKLNYLQRLKKAEQANEIAR